MCSRNKIEGMQWQLIVCFQALKEHIYFNPLIQYHLESYAHRLRVSRGGCAGSARGLPVRPPQEERTKHKTKLKRNLGNRTFFNDRVFVLLIAFVLVSQYYLVLFGVTPQYPRDNCYRKHKRKHIEQNKTIG